MFICTKKHFYSPFYKTVFFNPFLKKSLFQKTCLVITHTIKKVLVKKTKYKMNSAFYNLTFLNKDYDENGFIVSKDEHEYMNLVKKEILNEKYKIGDMLFIGSTYQTRQNYGFATITENGLETHDNAKHLMKNKNISYHNVINTINEFWQEFDGDVLFYEED